MRQAGPDPRLMSIARLAENHAQLVTETRRHIALELTMCDGYTGGGETTDGSRSTGTTSTTEAAVTQRDYWHKQSAQINDDITAVASILDSLAQTCRHAIATRTPKPAPTRCYADPGIAGYIIDYDKNSTSPDNGWHDPLCTKLPRSAAGGLCNACRMRAERWRTQHEQPALVDERTIEFDPIIEQGQRGAVHAYIKGQRP